MSREKCGEEVCEGEERSAVPNVGRSLTLSAVTLRSHTNASILGCSRSTVSRSVASRR